MQNDGNSRKSCHGKFRVEREIINADGNQEAADDFHTENFEIHFRKKVHDVESSSVLLNILGRFRQIIQRQSKNINIWAFSQKYGMINISWFGMAAGKDLFLFSLFRTIFITKAGRNDQMAQIDSKKRFMLQQLRNAEEIFVLFSRCTRLPFVHCDEETYNDEIYIFRKEEDIKKAAEEFHNEKNPVQIMKVENKNFLNFYSSLYFLGINVLVIDKGEEEMKILLEELVVPPDYSKIPEGQVRVDNPQFQLTAMYLMQRIRREPNVKPTQELKEMEEEVMVNMRRGTYIVPVQEDQKLPLMKLQGDAMFQPLFTDIHEFNKFKGQEKFRGVLVPYEKIPEVLVEQAEGIIINPFSVHVVMKKGQLN